MKKRVSADLEDTYPKFVVVDDNPKSIEVRDTAEGYDYSAFRTLVFKDHPNHIFVYDITNRISFLAIQGIISQAQRALDLDNYPCVLVANKVDLEQLRQISTEEGQALAGQHGMMFVEISATYLHDVHSLFSSFIRLVDKHHQNS